MDLLRSPLGDPQLRHDELDDVRDHDALAHDRERAQARRQPGQQQGLQGLPVAWSRFLLLVHNERGGCGCAPHRVVGSDLLNGAVREAGPPPHLLPRPEAPVAVEPSPGTQAADMPLWPKEAVEPAWEVAVEPPLP